MAYITMLENELSLDLIKRGENGKERETKEWIRNGFLKQGRSSYGSFISKVEQYYKIIQTNGRGKKRTYTLEEKEVTEKRVLNYKGDTVNVPAMMLKLKAKCPKYISYSEFEYVNASNKNIPCECLNCNYKWLASFAQLTNGNTNCPLCATTKGERIIHNILSKNNINFKWQHQFEGLLTENGNTMTIDFYVEFDGQPLVIEYHGQQHYRSIEYFGGDSIFKSQQWRDNKKKEYFKENNIDYLEIPYSCKNIEVMVLEYLLQSLLSKTNTLQPQKK